MTALMKAAFAPAGEPLTLTELSARSGYSAWHLHRQFRFYCGMPLQSYQRLLKLQRAATALAYRQTPVTELALEAGYQHAESFSRAFAHPPRRFAVRPRNATAHVDTPQALGRYEPGRGDELLATKHEGHPHQRGVYHQHERLISLQYTYTQAASFPTGRLFCDCLSTVDCGLISLTGLHHGEQVAFNRYCFTGFHVHQHNSYSSIYYGNVGAFQKHVLADGNTLSANTL